jgi:hypothetical protein
LEKKIFFLGSKSNQKESGAPIALDLENDSDEDEPVLNFKTAPGLLVSRKGNELTVLLRTSLAPQDQEHISGYLQFEGVEVKKLRSMEGSQRLEKGFDGVKKVLPGQDEVWAEGKKVFFHLTTSTADDGFIVDWEPLSP